MSRIQDALQGIYEWASKADYAGHDPHDLLLAPALRRIKRPMVRLIALQLGRRSVLNLHTFLRVPRSENSKALALFLSGLLRAGESVTPDWKRDAEGLALRLMRAMRSAGWGYPFPWQSRTHFLPVETPNIVSTAFAGEALLDYYEAMPSPAVFEALRVSAAYIASLEVPNTPFVAFGYAANDPQIVFNASLLGAHFLRRAGVVLSNEQYIERARRAAEFVRAHQRPDGGWSYGMEPSQQWEDSFHTGFIIVAMKSIAEAIGDARLAEAAVRGFEYYRRSYLEPDFAVRYFPDRRYPIDSHALGQALITFSVFGDEPSARRIAEWSIEHLRSPEGFFYYQRHRLFTNRIPYLRWSNAWMFRGLAEIVTPNETAL